MAKTQAPDNEEKVKAGLYLPKTLDQDLDIAAGVSGRSRSEIATQAIGQKVRGILKTRGIEPRSAPSA